MIEGSEPSGSLPFFPPDEPRGRPVRAAPRISPFPRLDPAGPAYMQIDEGLDRRQLFPENVLPVPLPSQITSLGRFRRIVFSVT